MIHIVGKTHQGKRSHNEDYVIADANSGLALVADGMGGRSAGEVASQLAADVIQGCLNDNGSLVDAILAAHREIIAAAHDGRGKPGMATTVAVAYFEGAAFEISWVGDSRVYLWNGDLLQLTRDHSYVQALIARGELAAEDAEHHEKRNLVTQALGVEELQSLDVKVVKGKLGAGDKLLVCSDGLNDELGNLGIATILSANQSLEETVDELVLSAIVSGGRDNISVVLVEADEHVGQGRPPPMAVSRVDKEGREHFAPPDRLVESDKQADATASGSDKRSKQKDFIARNARKLAAVAVTVLVVVILVTWFSR